MASHQEWGVHGEVGVSDNWADSKAGEGFGGVLKGSGRISYLELCMEDESAK